MLTGLVDCPYLFAHCRLCEEAGLKGADKTGSLGQSLRVKRLIEHQLNVAVQDLAFAL